jgi:hypothetical protein
LYAIASVKGSRVQQGFKGSTRVQGFNKGSRVQGFKGSRVQQGFKGSRVQQGFNKGFHVDGFPHHPIKPRHNCKDTYYKRMAVLHCQTEMKMTVLDRLNLENDRIVMCRNKTDKESDHPLDVLIGINGKC